MPADGVIFTELGTGNQITVTGSDLVPDTENGQDVLRKMVES